MISIKWLCLFVGSLVLVGAVVATHGQSPESRTASDAEEAIVARLAEIQGAAQSLDADKLFSFVLENDKGALVQNGKLFLTREAALQSTKRGLQGLKQVAYRFDQQQITLLSPTLALAIGAGVSSQKRPQAESSPHALPNRLF